MDMEELCQCVEEEWDRLDQVVIDNAISEIVNGTSDWQPALQPAEDILNIHSKHYCICSHTD